MRVDLTALRSILSEQFSSPVSELSPIGSGMFSEAFRCALGPRELVVRVSGTRKGFDKDQYAYEHFSSKTVPIPELLATGRIDDAYYAVSPRAPGERLDSLPRLARERLVPSMISALSAIAETPIDQAGYGYWDGRGQAKWQLWSAFLLDRDPVTNTPDRTWSEVLSHLFVDRALIREVFGRLEELVAYVPEERRLVHGDFGFDNLLAEGENITAVLDWGEGMYGDPLYDVGWLDFWSDDVPYGQIFMERFHPKGMDLTHLGQRLRCYKLYIGIHALAVDALVRAEPDYRKTESRVISLISSHS